MGLYDSDSETGSVAFAEKQFQDVRERQSAEARRQDRFNKKLLVTEALVQGSNALLNNRLNRLDLNQAPKRAAYRAMNDDVQEYKQINSNLNRTQVSEQDYLTSIYHEMYKNKFSANYENADMATVNFVLHDLAVKQAEQNAPAFRRILDLAEEFPEYGEDFDEYYSSFNEVPRNITEFVWQTGRDAFSRETPETLEYQNNKARDAFYGTEEMQRYTNIREAMQALDANGANVSGAMEEIRRAVADGRIVGDLGEVAWRSEAKQEGNLVMTSSQAYQEKRSLTGGPSELIDLDIPPIVTAIDSLGQYGLTGRPDLISVSELNSLADKLSDDGKAYFYQALDSFDRSVTTDDYLTVLSELSKDPNNWVVDVNTQKGQLDIVELVYQARLGSSFHRMEGPGGKMINDPMFQEREQPTDPLMPKPEYESILKSMGTTREAILKEITSDRNWMDRIEGLQDLDYLANTYHLENGFTDIATIQRYSRTPDGSIVFDTDAVGDIDILYRQLGDTGSEFYEVFRSVIQEDRNRYTPENRESEVYNGALEEKDILLLDNVSGEVFKDVLQDIGLENITSHADYADLFSSSTNVTLKFNLFARKLYINTTTSTTTTD